MRFDNRQVLLETDAVVEEIYKMIVERKSPLAPL
jgi:hypothetical protein